MSRRNKGRDLLNQATAQSREAGADAGAVTVIVVVALLSSAVAWSLPWWSMHMRAPQYGQRTLVVEVAPTGVTGDIREVDLLGHYVGIAKLDTFASLERSVAPVGLTVAALGLVMAVFLRHRLLRAAGALPAVAMPLLFLADVAWTMDRAVNTRDPEAALNLVLTRIDTQLFGTYRLAQFEVTGIAAPGLFLAGVAALLALGLIFAKPLTWRWPRRSAGAAAGALVALLVAATAHAAERHVSPGTSVSAAIAEASDGDTVVVPAGVFRGGVVIDRSITLVGRPGAILDGGGEGTVVRITAPRVRLEGLTLQNSGDTYRTEDAGIRIEGAQGVVVENLTLLDTLFGIFAVQADDCRVEGTRIVGKDLPEVRRGDGIRLWLSHRCVLRRNRMERSRDLVIWYSEDTVAEDNEVRRSRYGLHYMYSNNNAFRRNRFEDNQVGAAIMYSRGLVLEDNSFSFSNGPSAYGLLVKDADDVFIRRNRFVSNDTGLFFDGAPQAKDGVVEVQGNLIARQKVGVELQPSSARIRFYENAFVGNDVPVVIRGHRMADLNVWAVDGRGNYWSDAVTYDRDGDGVSELPFRLEQGYEALSGRWPELQFFWGSPVAEAIDLSARLFPLFAPDPTLVDPHPLKAPPLVDAAPAPETRGARYTLAAAGSASLALAAGMILGLLRRLR